MPDMEREQDLSTAAGRWAASRETAVRQWAVERVLDQVNTAVTVPEIAAVANVLADYVLNGVKA